MLAAQHVRRVGAGNTERAYVGRWEAFVAWVVKRRLPWRKASADTVNMCLVWMAEQGRRESTVRVVEEEDRTRVVAGAEMEADEALVRLGDVEVPRREPHDPERPNPTREYVVRAAPIHQPSMGAAGDENPTDEAESAPPGGEEPAVLPYRAHYRAHRTPLCTHCAHGSRYFSRALRAWTGGKSR